MHPNEHIYSVSQLCHETRLLLEGTFLTLTVEGEISNLARPASGHIYFTLKDNKAQVQCAMFKMQVRKIGFKPANGLKILFKARVSLYEARGNFQLIGEHMEAAGEGALRQQFEALKSKLSAEGLYDESSKKPLPTLANKIGVITSASGAAVHDVLTVLNNRFPALPVLIYPVAVQGENAKHEIVSAIELANKRNDCDCIILTRGGGSLEDLWAFNEEIVARAIHCSTIPIISAVGHEVDFTIADFVADYRAPTPSAAAEAISPEQDQWVSHFNYLAQQLASQLTGQVSDKNKQLDQLQHRLHRAHPGSQLQQHAQQLDNYQARLLKIPQHTIQRHRLQLSELNTRLQNSNPSKQTNAFHTRLMALQQRLETPIRRKLQEAQLRFAQGSKGLETLSPLATLSRGYSITKHQDSGRIINSIKQLKLDDTLNIQLADGNITTTVNDINDNA